MFSNDIDIGEWCFICDVYGFWGVFFWGGLIIVGEKIVKIFVDFENGVFDLSVLKGYWCEDKGRDRVDWGWSGGDLGG